MDFPDGTSMAAPFRAFNYMRNVFDDWLNQRAQEEGARFSDECELLDCEEVADGVIVTVATGDGAREKLEAHYVVDATGLLDGVRGVGQDAAALSGRLVSGAILRADEKGTRALDEYRVMARRIIEQTRKHQARAIGQFRANEELQRHLKRGTLRTGVLMTLHAFLNRFRSAERLKLLPP